EWVLPSQTGKAPKILIVRAQIRLMFDGMRGKLDVGGQIAGRSDIGEKRESNFKIVRSGLQEPDVGSRKPVTNPRNGIGRRERVDENPPVGRDAQETKKTRRWYADHALAIECVFPPFARRSMVWKSIDLRIEQQIDVGNDHARRRNFGARTSSSSSSASLLNAAESMPGRSLVLCGVILTRVL